MEDRLESLWPPKRSVLGINISATSYDRALVSVINSVKKNERASISHLAVHGIVEGVKDVRFKSMLNEFEILAPDGQPVRYALKLLWKIKLQDRCYGPEFMMRVCQAATEEKIGIYLYGSTLDVVQSLNNRLRALYPALQVVGWEPSLFRPLIEAEDHALVNRINESGAGIVFIGLGCPLQEEFSYLHKDKIRAVQICVGAAFDFHSGNKRMAPSWMQRNSLEWFFRLTQEPRRLWRRYLITNTIFMVNLTLQFFKLKRFDK